MAAPSSSRRYREVGVLHLARKGLAQGRTEATGGVYVPFVAGHEEGIEERDTLDVVPMGMGDEDMATQGMDAAFHEGLAESVRPGAAIEDNNGAGSRTDLNTRRVASEANGR